MKKKNSNKAKTQKSNSSDFNNVREFRSEIDHFKTTLARISQRNKNVI